MWSATCLTNEKTGRVCGRRAADRRHERHRGEGFDLTPKEKRWAALGAMKAVLMIAGAYLLGLGVLLGILFLLWK